MDTASNEEETAGEEMVAEGSAGIADAVSQPIAGAFAWAQISPVLANSAAPIASLRAEGHPATPVHNPLFIRAPKE
jgi:hypothetical protein